MPAGRSPAGASPASERGTALIGSVLGFGVVMACLLLAAQVTFALEGRSLADAAAWTAVRSVAGYGTAPARSPDQTVARAAAEREATRTLRGLGETRFSWDRVGTLVRLRIRLHVPSVIPSALRRALALDVIDRTVVTPDENLVCEQPCVASG